MNNFISTLVVIAMLAFGCVSAQCATTNASLTFYIVSEKRLEGGKFVDTPNLPRVGYISAMPDLVVTNLLGVHREKRATQAIVNGKFVPSRPILGLAVELGPEDAKRFLAVTQAAVGKRLLVALGETPLSAPQVVTPIEAGRFSIDFISDSELRKTEDELRKLVPPG